MPISAPPDGFVDSSGGGPPDGFNGPPDGFNAGGHFDSSKILDIAKKAGHVAMAGVDPVQYGVESLLQKSSGVPSEDVKAALQGAETPIRGYRGMAVGAEQLMTGHGAQPSLERASEATQPDFQPKGFGEKAAAFVGETAPTLAIPIGGAAEEATAAARAAHALKAGSAFGAGATVEKILSERGYMKPEDAGSVAMGAGFGAAFSLAGEYALMKILGKPKGSAIEPTEPPSGGPPGSPPPDGPSPAAIRARESSSPRSIEEKQRYEDWLKSKEPFQATQPPLTGQSKTNASQLRDYARAELEKIKALPGIRTLAEKERMVQLQKKAEEVEASLPKDSWLKNPKYDQPTTARDAGLKSAEGVPVRTPQEASAMIIRPKGVFGVKVDDLVSQMPRQGYQSPVVHDVLNQALERYGGNEPEPVWDIVRDKETGEPSIAMKQEPNISKPVTKEELQIANDTHNSEAAKRVGAPPSLVDSSPLLKGTEETPSMKPEILPHTKGWLESVHDRLITSSADALRKMGKNGEQLAAGLEHYRDWARSKAGDFNADFVKQLGGFKKKDRPAVGKAIFDFLEGRPTEIELPQAMKLMLKDWLSHISDLSEQAGLKVYRSDGSSRPFAPRENYAPRVMKSEIIEKIANGDNATEATIAKHLMDTRQAPNFDAALERVRLLRKNMIERKYGHLERARELDLPPHFYDSDMTRVLPMYMINSLRRIDSVQQFGLGEEKAIGVINAIGAEGKDADLAMRIYNRVLGRDPVDHVAKGALSKMMSLFAGSALQAQISLYHLTHLLYPMFDMPVKVGVSNFFKAFGDVSDEQAIRLGLNIDTAAREWFQESMGGGKGNWTQELASKALQYSGITPSYNFMLKFNALASKDWIETRLIPGVLKGDRRAEIEMTNLGFSPSAIRANKGLTDIEVKMGALRHAEGHQGTPDPLRLPLWFSDPVGGSLFALNKMNQVLAGQLKGSLKRAAETRDIPRLMKIGAMWAGSGTMIRLGRHEIFGLKDVPYTGDKNVDAVINAAGDGIPYGLTAQVLLSTLSGRSERFSKIGAVGFALDTATEIVQAGKSMAAGKSLTTKQKKGLVRKVPVVGTELSHIMYP